MRSEGVRLKSEGLGLEELESEGLRWGIGVGGWGREVDVRGVGVEGCRVGGVGVWSQGLGLED